MSDAVIADYVNPSEEILAEDGSITTENLLDEVNLYNLYDTEDSPEQSAEQILDITYPTRTLVDIIEKTLGKLDSSKEITDGAHIIGGKYGTGKSHIELVVYHLLNSPDVARSWAQQHDISLEFIEGTQTAALQMLNLDDSYTQLWSAVGSYLGIDEWVAMEDSPNVHQIRDAIAGEPTAVMIDEFERWFSMSAREDYTEDNLAFLQNLLEAAGRNDTPLVVHVSLLYQSSKVQGIVPRTNPFLHDLSEQRDEKINFILHRLVGKRTDPDGIQALAEEYANVYRQNDQIEFADYHKMENMIEHRYPFHPGVLDLLMEKFSEQDSHQDARGLLDFLTRILATNYEKVNLILTGDIDVAEHLNRFQYIDPELTSKYSNDYYRLQNDTGDFDESVEELLNITLLHSLARSGEEGANKRDLLMGTMRKGVNAHRIIQTFTDDVYGHAWHIHRINGEYAFDVDENPSARIQKKAEDIHKHDAIHRVESLVKEDLFDGHNNVYILDPVNTEQDIPDNKTLKIVVSLGAQRSYDEDFEALTTGQGREFSNTIVLVTPEKLSGIDTNTGIIELARKVVAGEQLKREEDVLPEGFDEIHNQNYQNLRDRVRDKFGTVHTSTNRGLFPQNLEISGNADFYTATIDAVSPDSSQLRSEIRDAVEDAGAGGIQYQHLRNDFYRDPAHTTLTSEDELEDAINSLCRDGEIQVGSYFETSVGSLGNETTLVHEKYIEPDEDENDEPKTITIDTTGSDTSNTDTDTGETESSGSGEGGTSVVDAFGCPECGEPLEGTKCDCGFEFSASDIEQGSVKVEGAKTEDLVKQFEELQQEAEDTEPTTSTQPFPTLGKLDAQSKPELIDELERQIGIEWEIHEAELTIQATLTQDDLSNRGISTGKLAEQVTVDEKIDINPNEPIAKQTFLSILWDLSVPEHASISVKAEVDKNE